MMFKKILIANRGEIACRIAKTAKRLGVQVVAIYSDLDRQAKHVKCADEAYPLNGIEHNETYLNGEKIIDIAKQSGAEAIHPGYGFLSENADFVELCKQKHIIFIGPPAAAIRAMGDKILAKKIMEEAGVSTVPGIHENAGEKLGFPLLVKAAAGGGGKGMRLIENQKQLQAGIESAKREAEASFGDSTVFLEKYIPGARHIEAQILFDQLGNGLFIFNRDCSIQRRHQKIIEEAPALHLSSRTLKNMEKIALKAGKAIHYSNAGTIEFLVDKDENFYFMEMNTRLQVEHPVTEMITGLDLVEWQLRIAAGESIKPLKKKLSVNGHAIEVRLYAENTQDNFLPSSGTLNYFHIPFLALIRVDSGFDEKDKVSPFYDPLIAKIIAWGKDRQSAITHLKQILQNTAIVGVQTNLSLLYRIINHPDFINAEISTEFIQKHLPALLKNEQNPSPEIIILASIAFLHWKEKEETFYGVQHGDTWRLLAAESKECVVFFYKGKLIKTYFYFRANEQYICQWDHFTYSITQIIAAEHRINAHINAQEFSALLFQDADQISLSYEGELYIFAKQSALSTNTQVNLKELTAPMAGKIIEIFVSNNQTVTAEEKLLVIEAMKMEHVITATRLGKIKSILCKTGDRVAEGAVILAFE